MSQCVINEKLYVFCKAGSNGMGQAQSQSAGTGCEDCYGAGAGVGQYEYEQTGGAGVPDPLRSSTGSRNGVPQQQVSTGGRTTGGIERGDQPPIGYPSGRITDGANVRPGAGKIQFIHAVFFPLY